MCAWPGCDRTIKTGVCCVRDFQRFRKVMGTLPNVNTPIAELAEAARRWEQRQQERAFSPDAIAPEVISPPTSDAIEAPTVDPDPYAQIAQLQAELAHEKERRQDAAQVAQKAETRANQNHRKSVELTEADLKIRFGKLEDAMHLQRLLAPEAQTIELDGRAVALTPQIRDFLTRYVAMLRKEALVVGVPRG